MRRGVMAVFLAGVLMLLLAVPARAAGETGTIRVVMGPELAGKTVGVYTVADTGAGELELSGEGWSKELSEEGVAMFTGLPEGMYLLNVENILAVTVTLPEADGSWMAEIGPVGYILPQTGQPLTPVLWAMGMVLSAFGIGIWYENLHKTRKK